MQTGSIFTDEVLDRPAVGVIDTGENPDAVIRTVAVARERGHAVFVAYEGPEEPRSVSIARDLGAQAVTIEDGREDVDALRDVTATVTRIHGFPGLFFHSSPEEYIDYERTQEAFASSLDFTVSTETRDSSAQNPDEVLVTIPAYNEASSINDVVRSVRPNADTVVVIDDGSTDDTAAVAEAAGAEVVQHDRNRGYGAALKTAFEEARERGARHMITLDGDGQHDADDVSRLVNRQRETGAEVVIGSRFVGDADTGVPLYRRLGIMVINLLTNLSLGVIRPSSRIRDTQSGFRAYDETAIETLAHDNTLGDRMNISTDILHHAHQHDYAIEEVGTVVDYDVDDGNNHNPISHGYVLMANLFDIIERTRPIMALTLPGFVMTFVGLSVGYWGYAQYVEVGQFPMDIAVVAAFLIPLGVLVSLSGIIFHSLNKYFAKSPQMDLTTIRNRT